MENLRQCGAFSLYLLSHDLKEKMLHHDASSSKSLEVWKKKLSALLAMVQVGTCCLLAFIRSCYSF